MKIIDLQERHLSLYVDCLEDWSDEMKEAGRHKEDWYCKMKDNGLRVKLALDDHGIVGGMIQYVPIEYSFAEGAGLYFIHFWMRASWFKKQGYRIADRVGMRALLWKPFSADAIAPKWVVQKAHPPLEPNMVTVTAFCNGWCPAQNLVFERAKRAASDPLFANKVDFREVDTSDHDEFLRWGIADALFINRKEVWTGPPPSYEKIRRLISKQVKKTRLSISGSGA